MNRSAAAAIDEPQRREYSRIVAKQKPPPTFNFRISPTVRAYLDKACARRGLKLSTWLKSIAIQEAQRILGEPPPPLVEDEQETED